MTESVELLVTHQPDGLTVALPQPAFSEMALTETRDKLLSLAEAVGAGELRLDFAKIEYLGSNSLSIMVAVHRRALQGDGHLALINLAPHLIDLFKLTRLDTILDIRASEQT